MIAYSRQTISNADINVVKKVLKSDFLTQGPETKKFEFNLKKRFKSKYAVSVNSASSALHLACLAMNIKKNDIVWTVPNTYAASANCALLLGAKIDFVDIDIKTFNISIIELEKKLIEAKKRNKLPKLLIVVHCAGLPCDLKSLNKLKKRYNFKLIEDASHATGSKYFNIPIGCPIYSDAIVFSFHPVKIITTLEGGCILTNEKKIAKLSSFFRENGIEKNRSNLPWKYKQHYVGYNFRINEVSAALGSSQLKKLDYFLKQRNSISKFYKVKLKNLPVSFQHSEKGYFSSFHLMIIRLNFKKIKKNYEQVFNYLRRKNYFVNLHYFPLHLQPIFKKKGFKKGMFPNSEKYAQEAISIPIYPKLEKKIINKFIEVLTKYIS